MSFYYNRNVEHYLIEPVDGGFAFLDGDEVFDSLHDLIKYYCITPGRLPCLLRPEFSIIQTDQCEPIAVNELPELVDAAASPLEDSEAGVFSQNWQPDANKRRATMVQSSTADAAQVFPVDTVGAELPGSPVGRAEPWFWPTASRQSAEEALANAGFVEGDFLLRHSSSAVGSYVLSLVSDTLQIIHVLVDTDKDSGLILLDGKPCGYSLTEMVRLCAQPNQQMLPTTLHRPCPRADGSPMPSNAARSKTLPANSALTRRGEPSLVLTAEMMAQQQLSDVGSSGGGSGSESPQTRQLGLGPVHRRSRGRSAPPLVVQSVLKGAHGSSGLAGVRALGDAACVDPSQAKVPTPRLRSPHPPGKARPTEPPSAMPSSAARVADLSPLLEKTSAPYMPTPLSSGSSLSAKAVMTAARAPGNGSGSGSDTAFSSSRTGDPAAVSPPSPSAGTPSAMPRSLSRPSSPHATGGDGSRGNSQERRVDGAVPRRHTPVQMVALPATATATATVRRGSLDKPESAAANGTEAPPPTGDATEAADVRDSPSVVCTTGTMQSSLV